jgi:hypothetical protein
MSQALSVADICQRALRKIGAYAIRSSGARSEEMEEARYWLDMLVGHQVSRKRTWWQVPATAALALREGVQEYSLDAELAPGASRNGEQFVIQAYLDDATTGEVIHEISLRSRREWEDMDQRQRAGIPEFAYIDRHQSPTMLLSPVPDGVRSYTVRLVFQSYSPNFRAMAWNNHTDSSVRSSWNLWLVTALAAQIGNGPVRKLPADEVRDMKQEAGQLLTDLEAYEDHEQANEPRRVEFYGGV